MKQLLCTGCSESAGRDVFHSGDEFARTIRVLRIGANISTRPAIRFARSNARNYKSASGIVEWLGTGGMSPDWFFGMVILGLLLTPIGVNLVASRRYHKRWDRIKEDRKRAWLIKNTKEKA